MKTVSDPDRAAFYHPGEREGHRGYRQKSQCLWALTSLSLLERFSFAWRTAKEKAI
jgi:hypothetical protein